QLSLPPRHHPSPRTPDGLSQPHLRAGAAEASKVACRVRREWVWLGALLARTHGAARRLLGPRQCATRPTADRLLAASVLRFALSGRADAASRDRRYWRRDSRLHDRLPVSVSGARECS